MSNLIFAIIWAALSGHFLVSAQNGGGREDWKMFAISLVLAAIYILLILFDRHEKRTATEEVAEK